MTVCKHAVVSFLNVASLANFGDARTGLPARQLVRVRGVYLYQGLRREAGIKP